MSKRPDAKGTSPVRLEVRVTVEEAAEAKATAAALQCTLSQLVRRLLKAERKKMGTKRLLGGD